MKAMQSAKVLSGHVPPQHSKGSLKVLSPTWLCLIDSMQVRSSKDLSQCVQDTTLQGPSKVCSGF